MPNAKLRFSSESLREFMRDIAPVWNKQCVRCSTVYRKFYRLCPECDYGEWLLEGEVEDLSLPPDPKRQRPQYRPREETIEKACEEIQRGWVRDGDVRATEGPKHWSVPRTIVRDTPDGLPE